MKSFRLLQPEYYPFESLWLLESLERYPLFMIYRIVLTIQSLLLAHFVLIKAPESTVIQNCFYTALESSNVLWVDRV